MRRAAILALAVATPILAPPAVPEAAAHGRTACPNACARAPRRARRPPVYWSARRYPRWGGPPAWQVGIAAVGMAGTGEALGDATSLLGAGIHLRYRGYRWGVSAEVGLVGRGYGDDHGPGAEWIERIALPVDISAMLYLVPGGWFNLYLAGGARLQVNRLILMVNASARDHDAAAEFAYQVGVQGGAGVEIVLSRLIALMADVRAVGLLRADALAPEPPGEMVLTGAVPERSALVQVKVGLSVRF